MSIDSFDRPDGAKPYVGALMRVVWQWVREQMYAGVVAAGYDDLNAAHIGLWRYPGLEGLRPSELADRAGIRKQSVHELLGHLEQHGYLVRVPDEADGRARVIRLTPKGWRLQQTIYDQAGAAEQRIAEILGPRRFAQLHGCLDLLKEQLAGSPTFDPGAARGGHDEQ
jgi:DNA-binding MarR family transcriptional regulator